MVDSTLAKNVEVTVFGSIPGQKSVTFSNWQILDGLSVTWGRDTLLDAPAMRSAKFTLTGIPQSMLTRFLNSQVYISTAINRVKVPLFRGLIDTVTLEPESSGKFRVGIQAIQQKELVTPEFVTYGDVTSVHDFAKKLKSTWDSQLATTKYFAGTVDFSEVFRYPDIDFHNFKYVKDTGKWHTDSKLYAQGDFHTMVQALGKSYPGSYATAPADLSQVGITTFSAELPTGMPTFSVDSTKQAYVDSRALTVDLQAVPNGIVFTRDMEEWETLLRGHEFRTLVGGLSIDVGRRLFADSAAVLTTYPLGDWGQEQLENMRRANSLLQVHGGVHGRSGPALQQRFEDFLKLIQGQVFGPREITLTDKHGAIRPAVWQTWEAPQLLQFVGGDVANAIYPFSGRWRAIGGELTIKHSESTHRLHVVAIQGREYGAVMDTWNSQRAGVLTWEASAPLAWKDTH